jgi:hypothetical protein
MKENPWAFVLKPHVILPIAAAAACGAFAGIQICINQRKNDKHYGKHCC